MSDKLYTSRLEESVNQADSFFEAETILEERNYDFNLVGNGKRDLEEGKAEVFIYELNNSSLEGFYMFEDDGDIYAEIIPVYENEPVI